MNKTFLYAVLLLLTATTFFYGCKKKNDATVNEKADLEQLGELKPVSMWFNYAGNPVITQSNRYVYEWHTTDNAWKKVGNIMPGSSGAFTQIIQDKQGVYYGTAISVFILNTSTNNWDTLDIPENKGAKSPICGLATNEQGDVFFQIGDNTAFYFFKKNAGSSNWIKIKEVPRMSYPEQFPLSLCNNGNVYFGKPGLLFDDVLNTNTGNFIKLFDISEPDNIPYVTSNAINCPNFIKPDGTVYFTYHNSITSVYKAELLKIDGSTTLPAKINRMKYINIPMTHNSGGWITLINGNFAIDGSENFRTIVSCNHYPDTHFAEATINAGSSDLKLLGHPLSQRGLMVNQKGETYIWPYLGNLYKWK